MHNVDGFSRHTTQSCDSEELVGLLLFELAAGIQSKFTYLITYPKQKKWISQEEMVAVHMVEERYLPQWY